MTNLFAMFSGCILTMVLPMVALSQSSTSQDQLLGSVEDKANRLQAAIQNTSASLQQLGGRTEPMARELQELIDRVSHLQLTPPEVPPPESKKPKKVDFRPPIERVVKKEAGMTLVFQNNRIYVADLPAINEALRQGQTSPSGRTMVSKRGDFDPRINMNPFPHVELVRKPDKSGIGIAALGDSQVSEKLKTLDPGSQRLQLVVYPDSFDAFRIFRPMAWAKGLDIQWIPFEPNEKLIGGAGGGSATVQ